MTEPTPLYDTLAAALRPLSVRGEMTCPLTAAINAAVSAVEKFRDVESAVAAPTRETVDRLRVEVLGLRAQLEVEQERHRSELAATHDAARPVAAAVATGALVDALEQVYVQAKARWDHEGGPVGLREAVAAVEALR